MTDEVIESPVTDEIVTPQVEGTEAETVEDDIPVETKSFTQAELDKIIQKEKAKAEAKAERRALKVYAEKLEGMTRQPQRQEQPTDGKPTMAQFASVEDYVEAVSDWKLGQRDAEAGRVKQAESSERMASKTEKMYAEASTLDRSFDREAFDSLPLTPVIAQAIIDSDMPSKIMVHLASNPDDAERIARLSPARQAAEIGKLEVSLSTAKQVKVSNAPAPIDPIGSRGASSKDPSNMSDSEFAAWRRSQISKRR